MISVIQHTRTFTYEIPTITASIYDGHPTEKLEFEMDITDSVYGFAKTLSLYLDEKLYNTVDVEDGTAIFTMSREKFPEANAQDGYLSSDVFKKTINFNLVSSVKLKATNCKISGYKMVFYNIYKNTDTGTRCMFQS